MRFGFILSILLFSNSLFSQDNFEKQIRQIIEDTVNHFKKFQGSARETSDTESSHYYSTINLNGTKDNWVTVHRSICSFDARIADSVTKSKGKKLLEEWKKKLISAGYNLKKRHLNPGSQFLEGWYFSEGNFSLSVEMSQYFYDKTLYGVALLISNEHPRSN